MILFLNFDLAQFYWPVSDLRGTQVESSAFPIDKTLGEIQLKGETKIFPFFFLFFYSGYFRISFNKTDNYLMI